MLGVLIGGRLVASVDATTLRKLFGWFVLLMASVILAKETSPAIGATAAGLTLIAAGVYITCRRTTHCPLRRLLGQPQLSAAAAQTRAIPLGVPSTTPHERREAPWLVTKTASPRS